MSRKEVHAKTAAVYSAIFCYRAIVLSSNLDCLLFLGNSGLFAISKTMCAFSTLFA